MTQDHVLVAYATKAGSTQEIAEFVAECLRERGLPVDVQPVESVRDISGYSAVVVGSAVRMSKVLDEAVKFARRFLAARPAIPAAYFVVCMTLRDDTPENRAKVESYAGELAAARTPVSLGLFGGKMDYSKLNFAMRWMFSHSKDNEIPEGDWRDWDAIRAWAVDLVPRLTNVNA